MIANLKLITAPTAEPLTVAEVKAHSRISTSADDALITSYIISARLKGEQITGRCFITSTWDAYFDALPTYYLGEILLPKPPLQSVTSITYIDTESVITVLDAASYKVDTVSAPGRIVPAYGDEWPDVNDEINAVIIRFVAGYGLAVSVPQSIKQWMMVTVADFYEMRESIVIGSPVDRVPNRYIDSLLDDETVIRTGM